MIYFLTHVRFHLLLKYHGNFLFLARTHLLFLNSKGKVLVRDSPVHRYSPTYVVLLSPTTFKDLQLPFLFPSLKKKELPLLSNKGVKKSITCFWHIGMFYEITYNTMYIRHLCIKVLVLKNLLYVLIR